MLYRDDMRLVLPELGAGSVQLILTSPPFNCNWDYAGRQDDNLPLAEYHGLLRTLILGARHVLRPGGVLAVNLPQTIMVYEDPERKIRACRAYPIGSWFNLEQITMGLLPREPIVWVKSKGDVEVRATSTAIGAYSNPYLRPCHEMILLASKDDYRIPGRASRWPGADSDWGGYLEVCKDVWPLSPGRATRGEPLEFPDDLATRLIKLFSNVGDVVLDPFAGKGTTGRMARLLGREAWLIERVPKYWPDLDMVIGQDVMFGDSG